MKAKALSYSEIARSPRFKALLRKKKAFLLPMTIFFFAYYFLLPLLTSYSTVLNKNAFGSISWAWIFAFSQFIMTWVLCIIYSKKSNEYDRLIEDIRNNL